MTFLEGGGGLLALYLLAIFGEKSLCQVLPGINHDFDLGWGFRKLANVYSRNLSFRAFKLSLLLCTTSGTRSPLISPVPWNGNLWMKQFFSCERKTGYVVQWWQGKFFPRLRMSTRWAVIIVGTEGWLTEPEERRNCTSDSVFLPPHFSIACRGGAQPEEERKRRRFLITSLHFSSSNSCLEVIGKDRGRS